MLSEGDTSVSETSGGVVRNLGLWVEMESFPRLECLPQRCVPTHGLCDPGRGQLGG